MCLKMTKEDNDTNITNLTYKKIFKLSVNLGKDNDKL